MHKLRGSREPGPRTNSLMRRRLEQQLRGEKKPVKVLPKVNRVSVRGCEGCLDVNHPIPKIPNQEPEARGRSLQGAESNPGQLVLRRHAALKQRRSTTGPCGALEWVTPNASIFQVVTISLQSATGREFSRLQKGNS
jgi:hypothetical protein